MSGKNPRLLLLETTGQVCSVALCEGGSVSVLKENSEGMSHASLLTVFIQQIFEELKIRGKDLDAVVVSMGPGSYTGIRIGVATAKGICYAAEKPLIAVNTLEAMSWGMQEMLRNEKAALGEDPSLLFCPMVDARRMEVYVTLLDQQHQLKSDIEACILFPELYQEELKSHPVVFFGSGASKAESVLQSQNAHFMNHYQHSAAHLLQPALKAFNESRFENLAYFEPFYLKDFVATIPKKKY